MLTIYEGSEAKIRDEMKAKKATNLTVIKKIKARYKPVEWRRDGNVPEAARISVSLLEEENEILKVNKLLPVQVGDLIFNYKLAKSFYKKLGGFQVKTTLVDHIIKIEYWKPGGACTGTFTLWPITNLPQLKHVPKARIEGVNV